MSKDEEHFCKLLRKFNIGIQDNFLILFDIKILSI